MTVEGWYKSLSRKHREATAFAEACEGDAKREMDKGRPRDAQVYATLAVSARLEAVSCAIQQLDG